MPANPPVATAIAHATAPTPITATPAPPAPSKNPKELVPRTDDEFPLNYDIDKSQRVQAEVEEGDVIFLPNHAIPMNEKLRNKAEYDSCSDREDLDLIDNDDDKLTAKELAPIFWKMGIDLDFRFIDKEELLYKDKDEAAQFAPMVSFGRPVEIPCVVLFDYHSGFTCMDMTVIAGDIVYVCAEEHQVLLVGREDDKEWADKGFPTGFYRSWQYSLCRREFKTRQLYSSLGLIPSSYLVPDKFYNENKVLFVDNWWWLGICSFDAAFEYLTTDRYAQCEGLFVIFSPRWLNLSPTDYRPYVMMLLTPRTKETEKIITEMGNMFASNIMPTHLEELQNRVNLEALKQMKGHEMPSSYRGEGDALRRIVNHIEKKKKIMAKKKESEKNKPSVATKEPTIATNNNRNAGVKPRVPTVAKPKQEKKTNRKKSSFKADRGHVGAITVAFTDKLGKAKSSTGPVPNEEEWFDCPEPSIEELIHAGTSDFAVQLYTIQRSTLGHYELMDRRYHTLHDLVWDLSHNRSHLPVRLVYDGFNVPPNFAVTPMEAPRQHPSPIGLPMNCEQWAARHYRQVTEPSFLNSPFQYCIRSFVNPFKDKLWKLAGLKEDDVKFNRQKFDPNRPKDGEDFMLDEPFEIPTEEHVAHFDPKIVIPAENLNVNFEAEALGKGNFGAVYRGKMKDCEGTWIPVVVKRFYAMESVANEEMLDFAREVDVSSAVLHPNVVGFYGMRIAKDDKGCYEKGDELLDDKTDERDRDGGNVYTQGVPGGQLNQAWALLVIECCSGGSFEKYLFDRWKDRKPIPTNNEMCDWMSQVARGLAYLHTRVPALAHGDVAARNILMSPHPTDPRRFVMKIGDLGLAKFMRPDSAFHLHGEQLPRDQLPPEFLKRRELSPAADIWSFGILLLEVDSLAHRKYTKDDKNKMDKQNFQPFGQESMYIRGMTKGITMEKPEQMPAFMYALFLMSTRMRPHDRISMDAADKYLMSHFIEGEGSYIETVYGGKRG